MKQLFSIVCMCLFLFSFVSAVPPPPPSIPTDEPSLVEVEEPVIEEPVIEEPVIEEPVVENNNTLVVNVGGNPISTQKGSVNLTIKEINNTREDNKSITNNGKSESTNDKDTTNKNFFQKIMFFFLSLFKIS